MERKGCSFSIDIEGAAGACAIGESWGTSGRQEGRIPVISCEGACVKGEIARVAANMVGRTKPFKRGCHGEMFTVPGSAIAGWMREAEKVVVIDGCFLHCHGRIMKGLVGEDRLVVVDALAVHRKYADIFDIEDVSEEDRRKAARQVADAVISGFGKNAHKETASGCCSTQPTQGCCGKE